MRKLMARDLNHPVWAVYDLYRSVKLNTECYAKKLYRIEVINTTLEIILLVTAPTSSVAGLWFWEDPLGAEIWKYLGAIAAFAIVFKQALQLTKKIKEYSNALLTYKVLEQELYVLCELIKSKGDYNAKFVSDYERAVKKKGDIAARSPNININQRLKAKCQESVNRKLPPERFWVPETEV
jgi:hypothetical protein